MPFPESYEEICKVAQRKSFETFVLPITLRRALIATDKESPIPMGLRQGLH